MIRRVALLLTGALIAGTIGCAGPAQMTCVADVPDEATPAEVMEIVKAKPWERRSMIIEGEHIEAIVYQVQIGVLNATSGNHGSTFAIVEPYVFLFRNSRLVHHDHLHTLHRAHDSSVRRFAARLWSEDRGGKIPKGAHRTWPLYDIGVF